MIGIEVDHSDGYVVANGARCVGAQVIRQLNVIIAERVAYQMCGRVVVDGLMGQSHPSLCQVLEHLAQLDGPIGR